MKKKNHEGFDLAKQYNIKKKAEEKKTFRSSFFLFGIL
jgi:hypothetical protein